MGAAETETPISPRGRTAMASRLQSPTSRPFPLGSNDDRLERAQARAAAAAAARRKSLAAATAAPPPPPPNLLAGDQIMELFHNCIRLASENKINQKNTWELGLIDHLSEIIRVEDDIETNFQKASCTLEAGVKIYSTRVDSVHSEAYKVLGGMNRAGREDDKENMAEVDDGSEQVETLTKKELERKMSPLSTLESSFEALNVKKFDVAFNVDPLYHQTSAQFDEGGAKGLLLNNLGVYGRCHVLFDSFEVPRKYILSKRQNDISELIDLLFAKEFIEQMMVSISAKSEISPTLRDIVNQFDEDNRRPPNLYSAQEPVVQEDVLEDNNTELECGDDGVPWNFDHDNHTSPINDSTISTDQNFTVYEDENGEYTFYEATRDEKLSSSDQIAGFISLQLGLISKSNAWAGPEHWKYRKSKDSEKNLTSASELELATKKATSRKRGLVDIDFTNLLEKEMPVIFAPPKNPKSLLLPINKVPCNIRLPEDCHYRPESLVKLFLLPNVLCIGKKGKRSPDELKQSHAYVASASWDNGSVTDEHFDDRNIFSDEDEDSSTLVHQPRQVTKVDIQYDKVSKQVDVHALKEILWDHIQGSVQMSDMGSEAIVSLKKILHQFPEDCPAASAKDLSPHLFVICLLHLANEHSLSLHDHPTLDELDIHVPLSALLK